MWYNERGIASTHVHCTHDSFLTFFGGGAPGKVFVLNESVTYLLHFIVDFDVDIHYIMCSDRVTDTCEACNLEDSRGDPLLLRGEYGQAL